MIQVKVRRRVATEMMEQISTTASRWLKKTTGACTGTALGYMRAGSCLISESRRHSLEKTDVPSEIYGGEGLRQVWHGYWPNEIGKSKKWH